MEKIYHRKIVDEILKYLLTRDIIVLHGARQVGKTSILFYINDLLKKEGKNTHYIDLEDSRLASTLDQGVAEFLKYLAGEGKTSPLIVFIDEIQYLEKPSSFLKLVHDHHPEIKLIVSGSSSFNIKSKFSDSLVGRTVDFKIWPLSFREFLFFKNYPFPENQIFTATKIDELKILFKEYILAGGYPKVVLTTDWSIKEKYLQQIIDTYIKKDIRDLAQIKDIQKFNHLLEILASQSGQLINLSEISNTCNLARQTIEQHLFLLEETYVIHLVRPFSQNIRSEISKMPKIFFYDTGLLHLLWLKSLPKEILGSSFETAVFSELIKNYNSENIFFWRTQDKKEVDFILKDKAKLVPIEVKLNFTQFKPTAINTFQEKYHISDTKIIGLDGQKEKLNFFYPWQL